MKRILITSLFCLFSISLFAGYNELVTGGIAAYKAQDWVKATRMFKKAYQIKPSPKLKKYYQTALKKAYTSNMMSGNTAYRANKLNQALVHYKTAYSLYPSAKLKSLIDKISMQPGVDVLGTDAMIGKDVQQGDSPMKWVLIGADVALAGLSVFLYMDQSSAAEEYNTLHEEIDATTEENYNRLVEEKSAAESKQTMFGIAAGLTFAAVTYTLVDMFILNIVFPKSLAMGFDPVKEEYKLALNIEF